MEKKKKFFSILIVPHNQRKILNLKIPHWLNNSVLISLIALILSAGIFIKYHRGLKKEVVDLRTKAELYREQNQKILYFSNEVENLRKEVEELKKIGTSVKGLSKKLKQSAAPSQPNPIALSSKAEKLGQGGPDKRLNTSSLVMTEKLNQDINTLKKEISQQKNIIENLTKYLQVQISLARKTPNRWPLRGWITSRFGWRRFQGVRELHTGIDIANFYGASIRAAADGTVEFSSWRTGYGLLVIINHGRGISTYYGHNSVNLVGAGQFVKKGTVIARIGSTGRTTGPHLHYEVRLNNKPINPFKYLY